MDDLIWRTDVVNYIEGYGNIDGYEDTQNCIRGIKALPPAQPEIKADENNHYKTGYDQGFVDACKMYEKKQPEIKTRRCRKCAHAVCESPYDGDDGWCLYAERR